MFRSVIDWSVFRDVSWWHWAATIPLLAAHVAGYPGARLAAIGLCALVGGYFLLRLGRLRPYPVQVRAAYLGLLLCGMLPGMNWVYWVPLVGTTAMVVVGYCPLLRMLSIAPWNCAEPLSYSLLWRTFALEPRAGGLVRSLAVPTARSCSVQCGVSRSV